jgi:uncharacterized protein
VSDGAEREKWDTGDFELVAGTTWMFAAPDMRATPAVDVLIVDEAGQLGLADTVAALSSARNAILLGDPLQLAQVSIASHPDAASASVLQHVLGDDATIPATAACSTTRRTFSS